MEHISSPHNPRIKELLKYEKASHRKETGFFLVEGYREILQAIALGWEIEALFVEPVTWGRSHPSEHFSSLKVRRVFTIAEAVFEKLAYREGSDGLLALGKQKKHELNTIDLPKNPFLVVLEGIEKPGNVGAMLRTCDAAGVDAVLLANARTDLYNPNLIRASLGSVFTVPIAVDSSESILKWLQMNGVTVYSAVVEAKTVYTKVNFSTPTALVLGTEASGLSNLWHQAPCIPITIPMRGRIDSLNVSNACAILVYEALRQRGAVTY
jgi:TrmH family RNA methyltransferase